MRHPGVVIQGNDWRSLLRTLLMIAASLLADSIGAAAAQAVKIEVDRSEYVIGQQMRIRYKAPTKGLAWAALIVVDEATGQGIRNLSGEPGEQSLMLRAPDYPGRFKLRFVNNHVASDGGVLLGEVRFKTVLGTPIVGALSLPGAGNHFNGGETARLRVTLPGDRYYAHPGYAGAWVRLTAAAPEREGEIIWEQNFPVGQQFVYDVEEFYRKIGGVHEVMMQVPKEPGSYSLKLYDRHRDGYLLDSLSFLVGQAPKSEARLRFVLPREGRYVAVPEGVLRHGDEFHLQAEYDSPPAQCGQSIELELDAGVKEQIPLARAGDNPRICRSALLRLERPDG